MVKLMVRVWLDDSVEWWANEQRTTICTKSPYLAAKNGSDRFVIIGKLDHDIVEDLGRQNKLGWKSRDGKDPVLFPASHKNTRTKLEADQRLTNIERVQEK